MCSTIAVVGDFETLSDSLKLSRARAASSSCKEPGLLLAAVLEIVAATSGIEDESNLLAMTAWRGTVVVSS